ncbi:lipopolysaccharide biosynthesis protein [Arthrobacter halodurans]|uniref:Lipopolysaccharide biosynthesis protein n=1 Tax=Arthrobacter halodurans TaxID=516699 RepID=A0ABV4UK40_9MICC
MIQLIFKSLLARGLTLPVTLVCGLLTTSLIIGYSGSVAYGTIALVATLFSLLPFSDLGLGAGVVNAVATEKVQAVQRSAVLTAGFVLCLPATILILLAGAGTHLFSWTGVLGLSGLPQAQLDLATALALVLFALSVPLGVGQRALMGLNQNHKAVTLSVTTSIVALVFTLFWTIGELPPAWLVVGQPLGMLLTGLACTYQALQALRVPKSSVLGELRYPIGKLFAQAAPMLLIMIGLPIALQSHRLQLAHLGTVEDLSEYSLAMQLYLPVWSVIVAGAGAMWSQFANNRGSDVIGKSLGHAFVAFGIIGGASGLAFGTLVPPAASILSGGSIVVHPMTAMAGGFFLLIQAIQQVPGMYFTTRAGLWLQARCTFLLCVIAVPLSIYLIPIFGASAPFWASCAGVALGQIAPELVVMRKEHKGKKA